MNITLSLDEHLVESASKVAESKGTSLNQLIREYLTQLAQESDAADDVAELRRLSEETRGHSKGWRFDREALHERS